MLKNFKYKTYSTGIWFNEGALADPSGLSGLHHLVEHSLFRDKEITMLKDELEQNGCYINAFTTYDITAVYIQCVEKFRALADQLIEDCQDQLSLNKALFKTEKEVVKNEIQYYKSDPIEYLADILSVLANNNKAIPKILGTVKTIDDITIDDLKRIYSKMLNNYIVVNSLPEITKNCLKDSGVPKNNNFQKLDTDRSLYWTTFGNSKNTYYYGINFSIPKSMAEIYTNIFEILNKEFMEVIREKYGLAYRIARNMTMDTDTVYSKFVFQSNNKNYDKLILLVSHIWENFKKQDSKKLAIKLEQQKETTKNMQQIKTDNPIGTIKSLAINNLSLFNKQKSSDLTECLSALSSINYNQVLLVPTSVQQVRGGIKIGQGIISSLE